MLQYTTEEVDGVLVIRCQRPAQPPDDGGIASRESLYQAVQSRDDLRCAVDLGAVDFLGSSEVGFLIGLKRRVDSRGGRLVLFRVSPVVLELLETMRLNKLFPIVSDLPDAIAQLPAGRST